jgi:hypothetical protein
VEWSVVNIPILPQSVADWLRTVWRQSLVDIVWKAFVVALVAVLVSVLAAMSIYGSVVAFILLGTLLRERVRAIFDDIWNRRFEELTI